MPFENNNNSKGTIKSPYGDWVFVLSISVPAEVRSGSLKGYASVCGRSDRVQFIYDQCRLSSFVIYLSVRHWFGVVMAQKEAVGLVGVMVRRVLNEEPRRRMLRCGASSRCRITEAAGGTREEPPRRDAGSECYCCLY